MEPGIRHNGRRRLTDNRRRHWRMGVNNQPAARNRRHLGSRLDHLFVVAAGHFADLAAAFAATAAVSTLLVDAFAAVARNAVRLNAAVGTMAGERGNDQEEGGDDGTRPGPDS